MLSNEDHRAISRDAYRVISGIATGLIDQTRHATPEEAATAIFCAMERVWSEAAKETAQAIAVSANDIGRAKAYGATDLAHERSDALAAALRTVQGEPAIKEAAE